MEPANLITGVTCLFILFHEIFKVADRRLFRLLWDLCKRFPCVHLIGKTMWFGNEFLLEHFPNASQLLDDRKVQGLVQQIHLQWLQSQAQSLPRFVDGDCCLLMYMVCLFFYF